MSASNKKELEEIARLYRMATPELKETVLFMLSHPVDEWPDELKPKETK